MARLTVVQLHFIAGGVFFAAFQIEETVARKGVGFSFLRMALLSLFSASYTINDGSSRVIDGGFGLNFKLSFAAVCCLNHELTTTSTTVLVILSRRHSLIFILTFLPL